MPVRARCIALLFCAAACAGDAPARMLAASDAGKLPALADSSVVDANVADARGSTLDATPADSTTPADSATARDAGMPAFASHAAWSIRRAAIWAGQYGIAGDPSVVREGSGFAMIYTCYEPDRKGTETCRAHSADGITWTNDPPSGVVDGRVLVAALGSWHEAHETPELVVQAAASHVFFVGYQGQDFFTSASTAAMGRAAVSSSPPFAFTPTTPVWTPTPATLDAYGMTSPSIHVAGTELRMVYTGWTAALATSLLAATSSDDGQTWTNHPGALVENTELPAFAAKGIAETCLRVGPDGRYYLFIQSIDEPHRIGVGVADSWLGPFTFAPEPILGPEDLDAWAATGPLAPHVIFDGDRIRMWFHAIEPNVGIRLGYAEALLE